LTPVIEVTNRGLRAFPVWAVYLLGLLPVPVLLAQGMTGALGVEPIKALEHALGELALQLMVAILAVTPLRRLLGVNLLRFRRALGILAFVYVMLHLLVWLVLDVQILSQIWADIVKRPYITIGMVAFVLMIPLALTSNNASVRWLGARWRQLHKMTYAIGLLGAVHFLLLTKGFQLEPLVYLTLILGLLALRLPPANRLRLA